MTKTAPSAASRGMTITRPSASRSLLARKAAEKSSAPASQAGDTLEALFPTSPDQADAAQAEATSPAAGVDYIEPAQTDPAELLSPPARPLPSWLEPAAPSGPLPPEPSQSWSDEDERALTATLARRKAAGYQRRGRDVSGQRLSVGTIKPNPNTIVATIVELVAARGSITRGELLDLMANTTFPHPKAKPQERGWCQGYAAGALRDGFLALSGADLGETSPVTPQ